MAVHAYIHCSVYSSQMAHAPVCVHGQMQQQWRRRWRRADDPMQGPACRCPYDESACLQSGSENRDFPA